MFQYSLARLLAERFGYELRAEPLALFPGTYFRIAGEEIFGPIIRWYGNWPISQDLARVDREELYHPPGAGLSLCGSFQHFKLFAENRDQIRQDWFRVEAARNVRPSTDFVISLLPSGNPEEGALPMAPHPVENDLDAGAILFADSRLNQGEIRRLARIVPHDQLYIVLGGRSDDPLQTELQDLNPIFVADGSVHDFLFILRFQKIAFSQNATHWWAAFLSGAREVYFPPCDRGYWSHPSPPVLLHEPRHHGIDLRVDEDRFIYGW